jgi:hypothetical protein
MRDRDSRQRRTFAGVVTTSPDKTPSRTGSFPAVPTCDQSATNRRPNR